MSAVALVVGGAAVMALRLQRGRLYVRITNSRSQRDRPTGGLGIGLRNTRERLAHLFGADHALTLTLTADRFGFEPEVTARLAQANARIYEVPISYSGRTYAEGKKIGWKDGVAAFWHIAKYNLWLK